MPIDSPGRRQPARASGRWPALMLAIAVHMVFIAVLIFSVRWQNKKPEPVSVELYAPPSKTPAVERPPPPAPPKPITKAPPEPEPAVEPAPKAIVKPPPPMEP